MITLPNGHCPACLARIYASNIEAHPSRRDLAIQNFWCPKCERVVKSTTFSIKPKGKEESK